jgi:hypothetical protein
MNTDDIPFFTQAKPKEFRWPVRVPVPGDGVYSYVQFTGVFKYLDDAGQKALIEGGGTVQDQVKQVLLGVEDIKQADGTPVPSSDELVTAVIGLDRAAPVTLGIYLAALRGMASEKNS